MHKNKHDLYLERLFHELSERYDLIYTNVPLHSKRKRLVAEIDILAVKGDEYDIYEVKCSYRINKAKKQLLKIKRILPSVRSCFFFCGESQSLELII